MSPRSAPISSTTARFLPPLAALVMAVVFLQWQAQQAQLAVDSLCAQFSPGDALADFRGAAMQADLTLDDQAPALVASKTVYRIKQETYQCQAIHDGEKILALKVQLATK